jgi:HK97 family phage prohead protease
MISNPDLRADLIDVPERRAIAQEFEVRSAGNNIAKITGYASVFDRGYDVYGGPSSPDGWTEIVSRSAFKKTLEQTPHVHLLINHAQDGGLPLASTKSNTLRLSTDSTGLLTEAEVDRRNSRANDLILTLERGDADEMSFAFRVKANTWSDGDTVRSLDEVSLHKGDVSVVGFGANPHTSVSARNAVRMLARGEFSADELAELRTMSDQVDAAMAALQETRDDKKPYGDVAYADPKNGKYPIDTKEHVKAAWSYINMPKNEKEYSDSELAEVKGRIEAAAKKFGIEISDEKNSLDGEVECITVSGAPESVGTVYVDIVPRVGDVIDIVKRALSPTVDGGPGGFEDDVLDSEYQGRDSLAAAVHDLVADSVGCSPAGGETAPSDAPYDDSRSDSSNMSVVEAVQAVTSVGNLRVVDAMRMRRPEDSPEPLTVEAADAIRRAS